MGTPEIARAMFGNSALKLSTETNLENPETQVVLCEKELQEDDSGNWASAGDAARNPGPTIGKGREARAVRQRDTNKQARPL